MAYIYALISAIFAALTSILAKIGISDINSNLATAIRTTVVFGIFMDDGLCCRRPTRLRSN